MSLFLILGIQQHFPKDIEAGVYEFFSHKYIWNVKYAKCIDYSV